MLATVFCWRPPKLRQESPQESSVDPSSGRQPHVDCNCLPALAEQFIHVLRSLWVGHVWAAPTPTASRSARLVSAGWSLLDLLFGSALVHCPSWQTPDGAKSPINFHFLQESFIHVKLLFITHWSSFILGRSPSCCGPECAVLCLGGGGVRLWLLTLPLKKVSVLWIVRHSRVYLPDAFTRHTMKSVPLVPVPFLPNVQSQVSLLLGACLSFKDIYAYTCPKSIFSFCIQTAACHTQYLRRASLNLSMISPCHFIL